MLHAGADIELLKIEAQRALAREDLLVFGRHVYPVFQEPPHIKYIARLLEDLESGRIRRLVLSVPVRHGKSVLASQIFPSWFLGRNPRSNIILASYSESLATSHSRVTKQIIESDVYPFSDVRMSSDSTSVQRFNVEPGGGEFVTGTGGGISGRGADLLICDDAVHDALSQTDLDRAFDWYATIAVPRLNPGGKILVIQARIAPDDLVGRIRAGDDRDLYTFVELPVICEADNPLGLPEGSPLWEERMGLKEIEERRGSMGEQAFSAQFLQQAVSTASALFRLENFGAYRILPAPQQPQFNPLDHYYLSPLSAAKTTPQSFTRILGIDCAAKETQTGSFTALVSCLGDDKTGDCFVIEAERFRGEFRDVCGRVVKHCKRNGPFDGIVIENAALGGQVAQWLRSNTPLNVFLVDPVKSKAARAMEILGMVDSGRVYLPQKALWLEWFRREIGQFPHGRYTDAADATVHVLTHLKTAQRIRKNLAWWERQIDGITFAR
jgi:predicted phage terminase large subunit-like protein